MCVWITETGYCVKRNVVEELIEMAQILKGYVYTMLQTTKTVDKTILFGSISLSGKGLNWDNAEIQVLM